MAHKQPFGIVDVLLIVVIVGLTFGLWYVIWSPGRELARQEDLKWESRARMSALRTAQNEYYSSQKRYTANVDSLLMFVQDSLPKNRIDSLFTKLYLTGFSFDSLRHAPKSLQPYIVAVNDTSAVPRYSITDPDGYGYISSLSNPDEHNKASWEQ
ncbi:MAG: hypothetical protein IH600_14510 [Bacteroidetes bacterium]|nr:hypothetical protein [Bacteroidota bacterium]